MVVAPKPPKPPVEAAGTPKAVPAGLAPNSPPPAAAVVGAPKVLVVCPNGALEAAGAPKAPPPPPNSGLLWKGSIVLLCFMYMYTMFRMSKRKGAISSEMSLEILRSGRLAVHGLVSW